MAIVFFSWGEAGGRWTKLRLGDQIDEYSGHETPDVATLIISTWPKKPAPHRHPFRSHLILPPHRGIPNAPGSEACIGQQK